MSDNYHLLTDYHMHSTFSPDGDHSIEQLCARAVELGLREIAVTEHAEWHTGYPRPGFTVVDDYFEAIETCRAKYAPFGLQLHAGVELGNPHEFSAEATELIESYPFDVIIGSVHWLGDKNIHAPNCFTGLDPKQVYVDYFATMKRLVENFKIDILAHFDRILFRGVELYGEFDPLPLEDIIRDALRAVARANCSLELNTAHVMDKPGWQPALLTMFQWYRAEGGQSVVINSDAHRTPEIARDFVEAERLLTEAGFSLPRQHLHLTSAHIPLVSSTSTGS